MASKAKSKCLICGKNKPFSRGACQSCLGDCHELIRLGQTTDETLIKKGMLLPSQRQGRKVQPSPVLAKLKGK
jgi:hypothetical protein